MHHITLANQIISEIEKVAKDKGLGKIKKVKLEIGSGELLHNNLGYHEEEFFVKDLLFLLEILAKNSRLGEIEFKIKKISGYNWKIKSIET